MWCFVSEGFVQEICQWNQPGKMSRNNTNQYLFLMRKEANGATDDWK
jgi:hypothetical protein